MEVTLRVSIDPKRVPVHVAIIMDGNRRWAAKRGLGPVAGHEAAARRAIEPIVERAIKLGIKFLTFWAFSTENWRRDKKEVEGLMRIFRDVLKEKIEKLHEKGVRLTFLGEIDKFPADIAQQVERGVEATKGNKRITVTFALNYGGRPEILQAIKKLLARVKAGELTVEKLDEKTFGQLLNTGELEIPDPDLIIRVGGELRLSGFLPWQGVYSELYFTPVLWPDFTPAEFDRAIADYQRRERRFGGGSFKDYQPKGQRQIKKKIKIKERTESVTSSDGLVKRFISG